MTATATPDPSSSWTSEGIAYCQVSIARDDLVGVAASIRISDRSAAIDKISAVIRQLEAARRQLA